MVTCQKGVCLADIRHYDSNGHCHSHSHHQIILPLNGMLELGIEGRTGEVFAMQGAIIPENYQHSYRGVGNNRFMVVDMPVDIDFLHDSDRLLRLLESPRYFALDAGLYHYAHFVANELGNQNTNQQLSSNIGMLLIELLAHRHKSEQIQSIHCTRRLGPALDYITSHLDRNISIRKLAALSFFSVGRFHALFRQQTGLSPGRYITELRMQKALILLNDTDYTLSQIAASIGYGSQGAFTHAFKRYFGFSPSYRHRLTKNSSPIPPTNLRANLRVSNKIS